MKTKITNIGSIYSWSPKENKIKNLQQIEIMIEDGIIIELGKNIGGAENEIDAKGVFIIPGFIDSHTHSVFFGNRSKEFFLRTKGKSYNQISKEGGGILSSIQNVRNASEQEIFDESFQRIEYFLSHGTTTIEAKSGYGLTTKDELKLLRVIKKLNEESKLDIIPTFMGAHDFPPEYQNNHDYYVDLICNEMIPAVVEEKLANFCDVFCEEGFFSVKNARKILQTAKENGLSIRLHADEFIDSGAAKLAAELGAVSADHLMEVSDVGIDSMAENGVIATLLPGTTLFLGKNNFANGRKIIDRGCSVAIASDFNPGSCTIQSMPIIISLACLYCGLTIEEAFVGSTWNGARSLESEKKVGAIEIGYQADLLFLDMESILELPYWVGSDRIMKVMKKGEILKKNY